MPPAPEFRDGSRKMRCVEVLHQLNPQNFGGTHGDHGISGEVAVDLHGKKDGRQHAVPAVKRRNIAVDHVNKDRDAVRQNDLQKVSPQHQKQTFLGPLIAEPVGYGQLLQEISGALDRPRDQLREEGDKQRISEKIMLRRNITPIDVNGVSERLKDEERDAHRQENVKPGNLQPDMKQRENAFDRRQQKIKILEIDKKTKIQNKTCQDDPFCPFSACLPGLFLFQQTRADIRNPRGEQDQQCVPGVPAHIKIIARQQQPVVFPPVGDQEVAQHNKRKKN